MKCPQNKEKPRVCEALFLESPPRIELGMRILQDTYYGSETPYVSDDFCVLKNHLTLLLNTIFRLRIRDLRQEKNTVLQRSSPYCLMNDCRNAEPIINKNSLNFSSIGSYRSLNKINSFLLNQIN